MATSWSFHKLLVPLLVQKIIKLGEEDYTTEDRRRDILKIEMEDNLLQQYENYGNKSKVNQEMNRIRIGNLTELNHVDLDKDDIRSKVFNELEKEEFGKTRDIKSPSAHSPIDYQQDLDLHMNQEGLSYPKYDRSKGKRGRKSLKELREADGQCREQQKIDNLLNIGKGKCLPRTS